MNTDILIWLLIGGNVITSLVIVWLAFTKRKIENERNDLDYKLFIVKQDLQILQYETEKAKERIA